MRLNRRRKSACRRLVIRDPVKLAGKNGQEQYQALVWKNVFFGKRDKGTFTINSTNSHRRDAIRLELLVGHDLGNGHRGTQPESPATCHARPGQFPRVRKPREFLCVASIPSASKGHNRSSKQVISLSCQLPCLRLPTPWACAPPVPPSRAASHRALSDRDTLPAAPRRKSHV